MSYIVDIIGNALQLGKQGHSIKYVVCESGFNLWNELNSKSSKLPGFTHLPDSRLPPKATAKLPVSQAFGMLIIQHAPFNPPPVQPTFC